MIEYLFPKSVLIEDNVCLDELDLFKTKIHNTFSLMGYNQNEFIGVESIHKTYPNLHQDFEFKSLVDSIYKHSSTYLKNMGYSSQFISNVKITEMWANRSSYGDTLQIHTHPNSLLSGAFYVESYPDSKLLFSNLSNMRPDPETFTEASANIRWYDCIPGRLIIFSSDMPHGTNQQTSEGRTVISFNLQ